MHSRGCLLLLLHYRGCKGLEQAVVHVGVKIVCVITSANLVEIIVNGDFWKVFISVGRKNKGRKGSDNHCGAKLQICSHCCHHALQLETFSIP